MKKSNLDEMQEQKMLKTEHNAFWIVFYGLLAAIAFQVILGCTPQSILGECIVFFSICAYMVVSYLRQGIWDRTLKADWKTNFLGSILGAAAVAVVIFLMLNRKTDNTGLVLLLSAVFFVCTFLACFGALSLCTALYKKRHDQLEQE